MLIDVLCDAGADPGSAMVAALAHREVGAVERLLERGALLTLAVAVGLGRMEEVARLVGEVSGEERQMALAAAALYGRAEAVARLVETGVDVNAYCPVGFHPQGTALHHAVDAGSLETVKALVEAGAEMGIGVNQAPA